jgi:FdrA protein
MATKFEELLQTESIVINIGLREFAESLLDQEVEVVHIEWSPPVGEDPEVKDLLEGLL